jgi:hypothetical protein
MIGRKACKPVGETGNSDPDEQSPVKAVEYDVSSVLPSPHRDRPGSRIFAWSVYECKKPLKNLTLTLSNARR